MSYELETSNHGLVPEFGFWGPDTTKIMLGELPAMPTPQFCIYATQVILSALSIADLTQRTMMTESIRGALEVNAGEKIRSTQNPLNFPRHQTIQVISEQRVSDEIAIQQVSIPKTFWTEMDTVTAAEEYFLAINASQGISTDYPKNPFRVEGTSINIGRMYEVKFAKFTRFATHYIGGGLFGWDSRGIPDYAHESLETLKQAIQ